MAECVATIRQREVREQLVDQTPRARSRSARTINKPAQPHSFTLSTGVRLSNALLRVDIQWYAKSRFCGNSKRRFL